jgi:hypothetical protein
LYLRVLSCEYPVPIVREFPLLQRLTISILEMEAGGDEKWRMENRGVVTISSTEVQQRSLFSFVIGSVVYIAAVIDAAFSETLSAHVGVIRDDAVTGFQEYQRCPC